MTNTEYCPSCGARMEDLSEGCPSCGYPDFDWDEMDGNNGGEA